MNTVLHRARRVPRVLLMLVLLWYTARTAAARLPPAARRRVAGELARRTLAALDIDVRRSGEHRIPVGPTLVIANHVSWLDAYVLGATFDARFVAKSETAGWPIVGTITRSFGALFIVRGSIRDAARVKDAVAAALRAGESVVVFPEATTTDGTRLRRFYAAMFQAAIDAGVPVQPAAIRYTDERWAVSQAAAFVDDMTFGASLLRVLAAPVIRAKVRFGTPLDARRHTRRELARLSQEFVAEALSLPPAAVSDQSAPSEPDPRRRPPTAPPAAIPRFRPAFAGAR